MYPSHLFIWFIYNIPDRTSKSPSCQVWMNYWARPTDLAHNEVIAQDVVRKTRFPTCRIGACDYWFVMTCSDNDLLFSISDDLHWTDDPRCGRWDIERMVAINNIRVQGCIEMRRIELTQSQMNPRKRKCIHSTTAAEKSVELETLNLR